MAKLKFECLLEHIQRKESIPDEILASDDGLCFGDICFALLQCSLHMQWVSLPYLRCLINNNAFKPDGIVDNQYTCSLVVLLIFLSDNELTAIKHMHIGLIVHCMGSKLAAQDGILPFVESIENDLTEARERQEQGKEVIANYGGVMALPMEPPFCLMYPTMYDDNVKDKTHFNTMGCPSGMCTDACMCCSSPQPHWTAASKKRETVPSTSITWTE